MGLTLRDTPQKNQPNNKLTKEDVWGKYDEKTHSMLTNGMIVARTKEKCPIFKDIVPFKSVTVVCDEKDQNEVSYWLSYVHGGDCIEMTKSLPGGKIAIRSNYMCW